MEGGRLVGENMTANHVFFLSLLRYCLLSFEFPGVRAFHPFPPLSIPVLSSHILSSHHPFLPCFPPSRQADCDARVKELSEMEE